ncbi:hypothetical protein [Alicyclobacillus mengziensis]|uniref:Uncharacterized protein n=1 Tax=Alicyclobacillus mengziensis TaxID=2931921 RepID=A0A9X7VV21_9BACL|nr:hypothetical protein [Alicyclobacillus mengziensis]QSO45643.1 hypothetical protein JZ786_13865 [Alicyclobacillus mengziensis]
MKRRWCVYVLIGIVFGVADFYLPSFIVPHLSMNSPVLEGIIGFALTFGVWLVPGIPIVIYETSVSRRRLSSALAICLTWCISVVVYYLTNVAQLAIGSSTQPDLRFSNHNSPFFWTNWESVLFSYVLTSTLEWSIVSILGGLIIGFLVSSTYMFVRGLRR